MEDQERHIIGDACHPDPGGNPKIYDSHGWARFSLR